MRTKDLTKSAPKYRGEWSPAEVYEPLDFVIKDGNGYISLASGSGSDPETSPLAWSLAVSKGNTGSGALSSKVTYSASDVSVASLAWDTLHVFPVMPSLSLTLANIPADNYRHEMVIRFETPADLQNFTWSFDSRVKWANNINIQDNLLPSTKYEISILANDLIGSFLIVSGSTTPRRMQTISDVALPVGAEYKLQFISDLPQSMMTYESSNPSVLSVNSEGIAKGIAAGSATASIHWANMTKQITFHVGQEVIDTTDVPSQDRTIDEVVIINPRATLEEGDEYALYAVGISNNLSPKFDIGYYNSLKFSSSNPNVATVQFGTLMAVGQGTCTITASDLDDNASASFQLTVTAKQVPTATSQETYEPVIDNTGATDVTVAIADAFAYASANGYKKISFPYGSYLMNGDNRPNGAPIQLPSDMIIDFNGSNIYFQEGDATQATFTMFQIKEVENVWLRNMNVYAENYNRATLLHKEGCRALRITGFAKNIHVENCMFAWSPGFNVSLEYIRNTSYPGETPNIDFSLLTLNNIEEGGLDANGDPIAASSTWRAKNYIQFNCRSGGWVFGMFEGYQDQYIRSLLYDMYFYDANHEFMYCKHNCYRYQRYEWEGTTKPSYCKVVFFQESAPTSAYGGENLAWICDRRQPVDVYFNNCIFRNAQSTGLSPQGGEHIVVDNCQFIDNGYHDPYSHIDWEDGRQSAQGHIVKNCTFKLVELSSKYSGHFVNGQVIQGYCTNITLHDNLFENCYFRTGDSSFQTRTFHNTFKGDFPVLGASEESVFAGNLLDMQPTFSDPWFRAKYIDVDNEVVT